jgi:hypothetical protein
MSRYQSSDLRQSNPVLTGPICLYNIASYIFALYVNLTKNFILTFFVKSSNYTPMGIVLSFQIAYIRTLNRTWALGIQRNTKILDLHQVDLPLLQFLKAIMNRFFVLSWIHPPRAIVD